jgi:hypothetical protein
MKLAPPTRANSGRTINAYWSSLLSGVLAFCHVVLNPTRYGEMATMHIAVLIAYLAYSLRSLWRSQRPPE